jgi:hypothetical protein
MATTPKKGSKNKKARSRRPLVKTSLAKRAHTNAELRQELAESLQRENTTAKELQERNRQLTEALEQQTATSEVLRVIAGSPTELQPVLDTVIESAVRLAGAKQGHIRQYDGEFLQVVAHYNVGVEGVTALQEATVRPGRDTSSGRAFVERKPIHVPDVTLEPTYRLPPFGARTFWLFPCFARGIQSGQSRFGATLSRHLLSARSSWSQPSPIKQ